jgi:hypothetical protein
MIEALRYRGEDGELGFIASELGLGLGLNGSEILYKDEEKEIVCPDGWHYEYPNLQKIDFSLRLGSCYGGGNLNTTYCLIYCAKE